MAAEPCVLWLAGQLSDLWLGEGEANVILAATEFDFSDILYRT